jgi:hypothetical protein
LPGAGGMPVAFVASLTDTAAKIAIVSIAEVVSFLHFHFSEFTA